MKKLFFLSILLFSFSITAQEISEEELSETDEIIDDLLSENETIDQLIKSINNFQFLYISLDYIDKTYFSGRDIGIDQFSIVPQITYINPKGFFVGLSSIYYNQLNPKWDYISINAGYGKNFGKHQHWRWSSSYTRYFYNSGADNPFKNSFMASLGIKTKKKNFGTQISGTILFGNENSYQITSSNFALINLIKKKNSLLKLRPQLDLVFGNYTLELSFVGTNNTFFREFNDSGLINTQLNIPLIFNINNFDFELGYTVNFPSELAIERDLETTSNFNFSIAYLVDLD